ncbi:MAG TPA: nucleotidyltransferase [Pyrinomonadaceae bacterium]|nr:nucleotidyltransferase [Pyrinomonadaceae bacterium]
MEQPDFQEIVSSPTAAFDEGLRFFAGKGMLNTTLERIARTLENRGIDYVVIGAVALNQHGYRRFTEDIDLLLTKEGLTRFHEELVGLGYRPAFEGSRKQFRAAEGNVRVEIVTTGEYPGDGLPKPVRFPDPADVAIEIDGIKTITLEKLVELKLASGMSAPHRLKDLADVQELIKVKQLGPEFANTIDPSVRDKFMELQRAVSEAPGA